jgi:hypothetical protein
MSLETSSSSMKLDLFFINLHHNLQKLNTVTLHSNSRHYYGAVWKMFKIAHF